MVLVAVAAAHLRPSNRHKGLPCPTAKSMPAWCAAEVEFVTERELATEVEVPISWDQEKARPTATKKPKTQIPTTQEQT